MRGDALVVGWCAFELEVGSHIERELGIGCRCVDDEDGDEGVGLVEVDGRLECRGKCTLAQQVADVAAVTSLYGDDRLDSCEASLVGDGGGRAEVASLSP